VPLGSDVIGYELDTTMMGAVDKITVHNQGKWLLVGDVIHELPELNPPGPQLDLAPAHNHRLTIL
jgi:hypothetical protein